VPSRRFPPPWSVEDPDPKAVPHRPRRHRHALAYVYFEEESGRRAATRLMTRDAARRRQHRQAAGLIEQEMMGSRLQPPKHLSLCAIAAALVLSLLLRGPAAGVTQRYCPTKSHSGRHDGGVGRKGLQICRVVTPQQGQSVGAATRRTRGHGISIELGAPSPN
jgi:hypothetical protein